MNRSRSVPIGVVLGAVVVMRPPSLALRYKLLARQSEMPPEICSERIDSMDEVAGTDGRQVTGLVLNDLVVAALQGVLPTVAEHTVAAVTVEVPSYADAFSGRMGRRVDA